MVAFTFDAIYFSLIVFLSALIPGVAIGWPLLKKTDFDIMEKTLISFFIGLFAVPTLLFLESLLWIKFSLLLVFANVFIVIAAGLFIGVRNGAFKFSAPVLPKIDNSFFTLERAVAFAIPALLLLAVLLAFWIRIQTFSPIYSELDPYYYLYGTGQIIREGIQPLTDDMGWWPEIQGTHRGQPIKKYLEAEWYALYSNGGEYNKYLLFTTASWLPPISAAFVSFGAYLLVSSLYGRRYGLFAAFLLAFLPITIYKMSAGVNEAAPIGNMVLFMAMGLFAIALVKIRGSTALPPLQLVGDPTSGPLAQQRKSVALLRKESNALHLLSAFSFFIAVLSSNFASVVALPLAGLAILQSSDYFLRGKKNHEFVLALSFAVGGFFPGVILNTLYSGGSLLSSLTSSQVLMALGGLAFAVAAQYLVGLGWNDKKRYYSTGAAVIVSILLIFATPVGGIVKGTVSGYIGAAEFKDALERTIAEQNLAGSSFEGEAGFISLTTKSLVLKTTDSSNAIFQLQNQGESFTSDELSKFAISKNSCSNDILSSDNVFMACANNNDYLVYLKNHQLTNPKNPVDSVSNLFYILIFQLNALFTFIGNAFFYLLDASFNLFIGMKQTTGAKDDSMFFMFLVIAVIGLAIRHFNRNIRESDALPSLQLVGDPTSGPLAQQRKSVASQRKEDELELPSMPLLILLVTMPVLYIGINKIKYTIFAGMMIAVLAAAAIAELERFFRYLASKTKILQDGSWYVSVAFAFLLLLVVYAQAAGPVPYAYIFTIKSLEPRYQDNPVAMMPVASKLCEDLRAKGVPINQMQSLCDAGAYANFSDSMNSQFDSNVCWLSQMKVEELFPAANDSGAQKRSSEAITSAKFRCNRIADYWLDSMEWINQNLDTSDRVTSWWDYGHWTNYLGDRKTVIGNAQASSGMIGRVAHDYIIGSTQDLSNSMNYFDSRYALFDVELIGGSTFGGKYGALNYLGCVHEGATTLNEQPGTSDCEYEHSPERIAVPRVQTTANSCTISESQQRTGVYAYRLGKDAIDPTKPAYCVGEATIATGEKLSATYYVDRKDANGDLVLSKGFIRPIDEQTDVTYAEMVYNNQKVWLGANGTLVDGMEDAKTGFYTSNLYKGFYLEELPGFDLVYKSKNGEIKIYRMQNFTGNKAGWIDPVESKRQN